MPRGGNKGNTKEARERQLANLRPFKTKEEASAAGKKGGKGRAAQVKRLKSIRETLKAALKLPAPKEMLAEGRSCMKAIESGAVSNQDAVIIAMIAEAISGNVRAAQWIGDMLGESPAVKLKELEIETMKHAADKSENGLLSLVASLERARKEQDGNEGGAA